MQELKETQNYHKQEINDNNEDKHKRDLET